MQYGKEVGPPYLFPIPVSSQGQQYPSQSDREVILEPHQSGAQPPVASWLWAVSFGLEKPLRERILGAGTR
jgi:hypothetical protein